MPRKQPQCDPIATYRRKSVAEQRVGVNAKCACGESRPEALIAGTVPLICFQCKLKNEGRSTTENHHPAGRANNPATIAIPVNDHWADLGTAQYEWPKTTIENPEGSPLIAAAADIRGFRDTALYLIDAHLPWIPEFMEQLDRVLIDKFGPKWWTHTGLDRFSPKRRR
jgi:hypothetical protein